MSHIIAAAPGVIGPISLSPWVHFNNAFTALVGYSAEDFRYIEGKTRISTFTEACAICAAYLVIIVGGQQIMRNQSPYQLNTLFKLHNLLLTVVSAVLLVLFLEQVIPNLWTYGIWKNICEAPGLTPPLITLYFVNYMVKYYELLDTVFLVLKKKPLTFLHCYHHPATAILCYTQLAGNTSISWLPIILNLIVHIVMYWYYFQSARGIKCAWKKWITRMQIAQFIIDIAFVYFASYNYIAHRYWPTLPHIGTCNGEPWAAAAGDLILLSYLVLFISFYLRTYRSQTTRKNAAKAVSAQAANVQRKHDHL